MTGQIHVIEDETIDGHRYAIISGHVVDCVRKLELGQAAWLLRTAGTQAFDAFILAQAISSARYVWEREGYYFVALS